MLGKKSLSAYKTWLLTKFICLALQGPPYPIKLGGRSLLNPQNYNLRFFSINKNDAERNV